MRTDERLRALFDQGIQLSNQDGQLKVVISNNGRLGQLDREWLKTHKAKVLNHLEAQEFSRVIERIAKDYDSRFYYRSLAPSLKTQINNLSLTSIAEVRQFESMWLKLIGLSGKADERKTNVG